MDQISKHIKDFNIWNKSIKSRLAEFIQFMKHPYVIGGYRFSPSGDRFTFPLLCSSVFATKILYMLNDDIVEKENISNYILKYLNSDGSIYDNTILKKSLPSRLYRCIRTLSYDYLLGNDIKRAETRQSYAALIAINSLPNIKYNEFDIEQDQLVKFILNLDWKIHGQPVVILAI